MDEIFFVTNQYTKTVIPQESFFISSTVLVRKGFFQNDMQNGTE